MDALILARWAESAKPEPKFPPGPDRRVPRSIVMRRAQRVKNLTRKKNRLHGETVVHVRRGVQDSIAWHERQTARLASNRR
jgi:transposase